MSYLSTNEFKLRTIMPQADVDNLEALEPGYLTATIADWSSWIDGRLRKRYAVPFVAPYPPILLLWLTKLVTRDAYAKRGYNPQSEMDKNAIVEMADKVEAEVKEAADSKDGLFDLPLSTSSNASGVSAGGPLGYSERSPYVWQTNQRDNAED
jgi:hypothetical protein